ncbi:MAG: chemotaxis protein CheA [Phycisphaerales bacterium]
MSAEPVDPELLQTFLVESGEQIEDLAARLTELHDRPLDVALINRAFRAIHTIKGSASFLSFEPLVTLAHRGEDLLNAGRRGEIVIDAALVGLLLRASDTLRGQLEAIRAGQAPRPAEPGLIEALAARLPAARANRHASSEAPLVKPGRLVHRAARALNLPPHKAELVGFLLADVEQMLVNAARSVRGMSTPGALPAAASELEELAAALRNTAEFFECEPMCETASLLGRLASRAPSASASSLSAAASVAESILDTLQAQHDALAWGRQPVGSDEDLRAALDSALDPTLREGASRTEPVRRAPAGAPAPADSRAWVRIDQARLDELANLAARVEAARVRVTALCAVPAGAPAQSPRHRAEAGIALAALAAATTEVRTAIARMRHQPLSRVLTRVPRMVRELASTLGKELDLVIDGAEVEVEPAVAEALADPLVHLIRNAADHGIESPSARRAAGKRPMGVIRIAASIEGMHVVVRISDDGRGIDPRAVARSAVAKGVISPAEADALSPAELARLVFRPGFSTAERVTGISGRGVGLDVVVASVERAGGSVDLRSEPGRGTEFILRFLCRSAPLAVPTAPEPPRDVPFDAYRSAA